MLRQNWPGDEDKYNTLQIESYELGADGKYEVCNMAPPQVWSVANCLNVLFEMRSCLCETLWVVESVTAAAFGMTLLLLIGCHCCLNATAVGCVKQVSVWPCRALLRVQLMCHTADTADRQL